MEGKGQCFFTNRTLVMSLIDGNVDFKLCNNYLGKQCFKYFKVIRSHTPEKETRSSATAETARDAEDVDF